MTTVRRRSRPLQDEVRALARERDAVDPRPQLPGARGPGRRRLRRRLARPLARRRRRPTPTRSSSAASTSWPRRPRSSRPEKTVLIPDLDAGCSLAASITAEQLRAWKAEHPGAVVVSYVNTTAEVKAETDYCCTSGNAKARDRGDPARTARSCSCPDMFLGLWLEKVTGRKLHDLDGRVPRPRRHPAAPTSSAGRPRRPTPSCSSTPSAAARARRWRSATSARTSSRPRG